MNPKYPVFVPTKGRYESLLTIKAFEEIRVPYKAVIEEQEYDNYAAVIDPKKIIVLPHRDKGLTVTRNWIWDYAYKKGYERFWTFDDNIHGLYRLNRNLKLKVCTGTVLKIIEDFTERYTNVPISGMNYFMFASRKSKNPPYYLNTRVYSNMLIKTDVRDSNGEFFRNVTFYNDDTDLCLRILKDGFCTILFNAFLIYKATTMTMKGGMTEYYKSDECEGRKKFAQELVDAHPDVARLTWKFGRWHHQVNYKPFKHNKLVLRDGLEIPDRVNNHGLILKNVDV